MTRVQISILNYNGARYLREAIDCALGQTERDIAVVVVDDRSTDGSERIVDEYDDPRLSLHVNPENLGLSRNWTHAAQLAKGKADAVCVLHQDDLLAADFAERMADTLDRAPGAVAAICNTQIVDAGGRPVHVPRLRAKWRHHRGPFREVDYELLLDGNYIYGCSWLARPELFGEVAFSSELGWVPDWDLWLRVLAEPDRVQSVPEALSMYRMHTESLTFGDATIRRRLGEETRVVRDALARRPVPPRVRRRAIRMISVRAVAYALQTAAQRRYRLALDCLRELVHQRGVRGVVVGVVGLAMSRDVRVTVRDRITGRGHGKRRPQ